MASSQYGKPWNELDATQKKCATKNVYSGQGEPYDQEYVSKRIKLWAYKYKSIFDLPFGWLVTWGVGP